MDDPRGVSRAPLVVLMGIALYGALLLRSDGPGWSRVLGVIAPMSVVSCAAFYLARLRPTSSARRAAWPALLAPLLAFALVLAQRVATEGRVSIGVPMLLAVLVAAVALWGLTALYVWSHRTAAGRHEAPPFGVRIDDPRGEEPPGAAGARDG